MKTHWTIAVGVVLLLGIALPQLYALEIVVDQVDGEVDVKQGSTDWISATPGMKLSPGDQISTGFDSKLILKFEDNSVVTVKPLTQLTIDRFFKDQAAVHTDLAVKIGTVRAKVNRTGDLASDFVVITPTSVVSVRGTEEEIHVAEKSTDVDVIHGIVRGESEQGQPTNISQGQAAQFVEGEQLVGPMEKAVEYSRTNTVGGFGLTPQEIQATQLYTNPTFDPGGASTGQANPAAHPAPAALVVSSQSSH